MLSKEEIITNALVSLVERGEALLDIDAWAVIDKETANKIKELKQKILSYLGDDPSIILKRLELIRRYFPNYIDKIVDKSPIIFAAILLDNIEVSIYASGEIVIKSKDRKFNYKRKVKDVSQFLQTYAEYENDPNKKVKLLFTTEELLHLLSAINLKREEINTLLLNKMIAGLIIKKIKERDILPFRNEEEQIAFNYFILALRDKVNEKEIYDIALRDKVINNLDEDPEYTIFYDSKEKELYIPSKFIRFTIERNPRMVLRVMYNLGIKDTKSWKTSYVKNEFFNQKVNVRYYKIKITSLNSVLSKLGYEPIEIEYLDGNEIEKRIKEKEQEKIQAISLDDPYSNLKEELINDD